MHQTRNHSYITTVIAAAILLIPAHSSALLPSKGILAGIENELEESNLRNYEIEIAAYRNSVTLDGTVQSQRDKEVVEQIALRTAGVRSVKNNLKVAPLQDARASIRLDVTERNDKDISDAVRQAIGRTVPAALNSVRLATEDGVVTLKGSLPTRLAIDHVLAVTLMVDGVSDIESEILVNGKTYAQSYSQKPS
ncbi:MAG: BON domain-containing protein [Deltaproteobacteria bacterium]|nr:BON domain-containing protein [Deltaproteobacteria bacterium]